MEKKAIGIDIGGTTLKGALILGDGRPVCGLHASVAALGGARSLLEAMLGMIGSLLQKAGSREDIQGVGIGTPGFVDRDGVIFGEAVNLPGWQGTRLYEPIAERYGLKAVAVNDAAAATLAEARFGAGRGFENLVCYTLGTGIGGGIITSGKLYRGARGMAGEFGHVSVEPEGIPCACGQSGCVERYASAAGIVGQARAMCASDEIPVTAFTRFVLASGEKLTAEQVYDFARKGDSAALLVHDRVCEKLARAIGMTINMLAPDLVVLGGGVMQAGSIIVETVKNFLPALTLPELWNACDVRAAKLGVDAGVIGAGSLLFEENDTDESGGR